MQDKAKSDGAAETPANTFNPRRFRTTVPFYARYRLGYPDSLVARVVELTGLKPGDAVMDLGCGPGLLAVPLAKAGMRVTAVDPEPDMRAACAEAAREAGVAVDVRAGSSFDLPKDAGPFALVTMGRAFHWMDREATLIALDGMVTRGGALALFDDEHVKTAENAWHSAGRELSNRYGRTTSPNVARRMAADFRSDHSLLMDSAFPRIDGLSAFVRHSLSADEIVGRAFSMSTTSPERLGDRADAFEADLRAMLKELSPEGRFAELVELNALVARRA